MEVRMLDSPALDYRKHMIFGLLKCYPLLESLKQNSDTKRNSFLYR
jgi:hypothetical protein